MRDRKKIIILGLATLLILTTMTTIGQADKTLTSVESSPKSSPNPIENKPTATPVNPSDNSISDDSDQSLSINDNEVDLPIEDIINEPEDQMDIIQPLYSTNPLLEIDAPSSVSEESYFTVNITSNGTSVFNATVIWGDNITYTNHIGRVYLTAPSVDMDTELIIRANKSGYNGAIDLIIVRNNMPNQPSELFVDDDFTPSTPGWGITHFNTIQKALDNSSDNDTINVKHGNYYENLIINTKVSLLGSGTWSTKIIGKDLQGYWRNNNVISIRASGVTISRFTIQCQINEFGEYNATGIQIENSNNNEIANNIFSKLKIGIFVYYSGNNIIRHNGIYNEEGSKGIYLFGSMNGQIFNNFLRDQRDYGISALSSDLNTINNNYINNQSVGLKIDNSDENLIQENKFRNNQIGLKIRQALLNDVRYNDFFNTSVQEDSYWYQNNTWDFNYYEDHTGVDINGDGIGDSPYLIPGTANNEDFHPLMNPYDSSIIILCGDINGDGEVNVGDIVGIIDYVFTSSSLECPPCQADVTNDGLINVGDAVYLINYIFKGGPAPGFGCCL